MSSSDATPKATTPRVAAPAKTPPQSDTMSQRSPATALGKGLRWSAGNIVIGRALSMVSSIVLARILTPEVFGVFAIALVVLTGLISMNDLGVTNAIVRWPGDPTRATRTATTLAWTTSVTVCVIAVSAAPMLAAWSNAPEATLPMQVLALAVLVDGAAAVPGALLTRGFHQDRRARADLASLVVSIAASVGLALGGLGVWALVLGRLLGNAVAAGGVLIVAPARPHPGWNSDDARALLRFGAPLVGASALVFAMANLDTIVIARTVGAGAALGFYVLAFNLSSWPLNVLSGALRRVSLPTFAAHQHDDAALSRSVLGTVQIVGALAALPCMLLAALAPWMISAVYGRQWLPAASPLVYLAVLGWVRVLTELGWDALIATGRTRRVLVLQCCWTLTLVPALILGANVDGIRGVAIAHAAIATVIVIPAFALALRRLGTRVPELIRRTARPIVAAFIIGVATAALAFRIADPAIVVLIVTGPLSVAAFTAIVWRPRSLRLSWHDIVGNPH